MEYSSFLLSPYGPLKVVCSPWQIPKEKLLPWQRTLVKVHGCHLAKQHNNTFFCCLVAELGSQSVLIVKPHRRSSET